MILIEQTIKRYRKLFTNNIYVNYKTFSFDFDNI